MTTDVRRRSRSRERTTLIITVARSMFRDRGFHAVSMNEIGAAAGITGAGIYRHFVSKEELLAAVLDSTAEKLYELPYHQGGTPPTIEDYVKRHVDFCFSNTDLVEVWYQERRNLLSNEAREAQGRIQLRYIDQWVHALLARRPSLRENEARVMVHAAIALIHSIRNTEPTLGEERLHHLFTKMTLAVLNT